VLQEVVEEEGPDAQAKQLQPDVHGDLYHPKGFAKPAAWQHNVPTQHSICACASFVQHARALKNGTQCTGLLMEEHRQPPFMSLKLISESCSI